MKKSIVVLLVVVALLMCTLTACGSVTSPNPSNVLTTELADFKVIEGKEYLAYDVDTRVIYYMFSTSSRKGYAGYGTHILRHILVRTEIFADISTTRL